MLRPTRRWYCAAVLRTPRQRARKNFLVFHEARQVVRSASLKSFTEWQQWCRAGHRPGGVPALPSVIYADAGWKGFADWLGYQARPRRAPRPLKLRYKESRIVARERAREVIRPLLQASAFEFQWLPYRASAQLVYRLPGDTLWSPLILRSMRDHFPSRGRRTVCFRQSFEGLQDRSFASAGLFFIIVQTSQVFFFPRSALLSFERTAGTLRPLVRVQREQLPEFEIIGSDAFDATLRRHKAQAPLLDEENFGERLFSDSNDTVLHCLGQQAVDFLRKNCGITAHRPSSADTDGSAHFTLADNLTMVARVCIRIAAHRNSQRLDLGLRRDIMENDGRSTKCALERCPDFIVALVSLEAELRTELGSGRVLGGFFLLPREYLDSIGSLRRDGEAKTGRTAMYVFAPWDQPRRRKSMQKKQEQSKYFVDLSPGADVSVAVTKAKGMIESYKKKSADFIGAGETGSFTTDSLLRESESARDPYTGTQEKTRN